MEEASEYNRLEHHVETEDSRVRILFFSYNESETRLKRKRSPDPLNRREASGLEDKQSAMHSAKNACIRRPQRQRWTLELFSITKL